MVYISVCIVHTLISYQRLQCKHIVHPCLVGNSRQFPSNDMCVLHSSTTWRLSDETLRRKQFEAELKMFSIFSGEARKGRGGEEETHPAIRVCAPRRRIYVQRETEWWHAEEKSQGYQGGPRENEVQSRREWHLFLSAIILPLLEKN